MVLADDRIVTATQADKIAAGLWYVEVHTTVFPLGNQFAASGRQLQSQLRCC
jgi:hypothetical protein